MVLSGPKSMQPILEPFSFPCADKLYGDANFFFEQDLAHSATATTKWLADHVITVA